MALDFDVIVIGSGFGAAVRPSTRPEKGMSYSSWSGTCGGGHLNCLPRIR